jgi:ribose transport system permease protein
MRQATHEPALEPERGEAGSFGYRLLGLPFFNTLLAIVILYLVCTAITGETFNTVQNQITILRAASIFRILAVGQTLVMNTGGIDISTGSIVGVVGVLIGTGLQAGVIDPNLAIPLAVLLGAALGAFNGFNITVLGVPPLLAPLGTFVAYRGFAQHYMGANMVSGMPEIVVAFGRSFVLGIPLAVHAARRGGWR